jgi:hypothetical protein
VPFNGIKPAPAGKAVAYVFRPAAFPQAINRFSVRFDGGFAIPVELRNGSWARIVVDPGQYKITATGQVMFMTCAPAEVNLGVDEIAFVQLSVRMWGDGRQTNQSCALTSVKENDATRILVGLSEATQ